MVPASRTVTSSAVSHGGKGVVGGGWRVRWRGGCNNQRWWYQWFEARRGCVRGGGWGERRGGAGRRGRSSTTPRAGAKTEQGLMACRSLAPASVQLAVHRSVLKCWAVHHRLKPKPWFLRTHSPLSALSRRSRNHPIPEPPRWRPRPPPRGYKGRGDNRNNREAQRGVASKNLGPNPRRRCITPAVHHTLRFTQAAATQRTRYDPSSMVMGDG